MSQVNVEVKSQLKQIVEDLERISTSAKQVEKALGDAGQETEDKLKKSTSNIEKFLDNTRNLGRRMLDSLKGDLKSLAGLGAIGGALKISNQFAGTVKDTFSLSDAIRKLGQTFGIASGNFANFQARITKGLGEVGLSSQVATDSLQALADSPVRGEEALIHYSKTAGELASISREGGQEGSIAKGISDVIVARGGNPNDRKQVDAVAEDLRRVFNQTGQGPSSLLKSMQQIYQTMPQDLRKAISTHGLVNLAAGGQVAGPGSTKFIEELLGKSPIARKALEAQGFGKIFNNNGLDVDKFKKASNSILSRIGFDPQAAAQTLGISEEAAQGFVRLSESLDKVRAAQDGIEKQTGSLNEQYKKNLGFGESFRANINKVKGVLASPFSKITQGATDLMAGAAGTGGLKGDLLSGGIVAGGGLLAALLLGKGLRGVGGGLLGSVAKGGIAGELTGEKVQPVYVVNAAEIGGGGMGMLGGATAAGGMATIATILASIAALAGGVGIGLLAKPYVDKGNEKIEGGMEKFLDMIGLKKNMLAPTKPQTVKVELNKRELRESKPLTKGATY